MRDVVGQIVILSGEMSCPDGQCRCVGGSGDMYRPAIDADHQECLIDQRREHLGVAGAGVAPQVSCADFGAEDLLLVRQRRALVPIEDDWNEPFGQRGLTDFSGLVVAEVFFSTGSVPLIVKEHHRIAAAAQRPVA